LASDELGDFQRETLSLVLPRTMKLEFVPAHTWIHVDRFVLPSYLSGRCNGYLHENYYAEIRRRITRGLGLEESAQPELRLYLSRSTARRRRVANENALRHLLGQYGFIEIRPETLSMREQVSLFQRAEVIVGPHGAALGGIVFAPRAKVLVLYPQRNPGEYFYTMAQRLGIEHYGVAHDFVGEEDDVEEFNVDLSATEAMLEDKMGLQKAGRNWANRRRPTRDSLGAFQPESRGRGFKAI
jgi:capsular polysaccharide biosynthesis protein